MTSLYSATVGLLFLICYAQWHFLWRPYILEKFRDDLFMVREKLFDYARTGKIEFSDEAYLLLRKRINSLLRYGHRINFTNLFVVFLFPLSSFEKYSKEHKQEFIDAIEALPNKESKELIYEIKNTVAERIIKYLFNSAPLLILLIPVSLFIQILRDLKAFIRLFLATNKIEVLKKYLTPSVALHQIKKDLGKIQRNGLKVINIKVGMQMEQEIFLEENQKEYLEIGAIQAV